MNENQSNLPGSPAALGFSPSADAGANVAALQKALDGGGVVTINTPGVYDLNDTIFLDSNTRLICAPGVVFRKVAPYCNVLINRGALTKTYNENITIDGLELSVNGHEAEPSLVYGLRGQLGFFYVKNLTLRNFTCTDGQPHQFLVYIVTWSQLLVENVRLAGDKDGIKLANGHDATLRNLDLCTYDDGLSLCGTDYPSIVLEVGDVYNVHCSNIRDHQYKNIFGRTCLIYTGSWADYQDGNEYGCGDFCLHDGKLYQVVADGGFVARAAAAPTHTDGIAAGADNIPWRFIQLCDFHQTNVYNVTFEGCVFAKSGNVIANWTVPAWHYEKHDGVHRPFYPGTEPNSGSWAFGVSNCKLAAAGPQVLVNLMGNMKDIAVTGCSFTNPRSTVINVDEESPNEELIATIAGCTFAQPAGGGEPFDHEDCPILRKDMQDAGKLVAVHSGGKVTVSAAGNAYRGTRYPCEVSNGSQLRFSSTDVPVG